MPITTCCNHPCTIYIWNPPKRLQKPERLFVKAGKIGGGHHSNVFETSLIDPKKVYAGKFIHKGKKKKRVGDDKKDFNAMWDTYVANVQLLDSAYTVKCEKILDNDK